MSKPNVFTAALGSGNNINIYNAMTGSIYRVVTLSGGTTVISGPVVFGDGQHQAAHADTGEFYEIPSIH